MNVDELLVNLYDKKTIAEIEQLAITKFNIFSTDLMQKAAKACVDQLLEDYPNAQKFIIFCGVGKNSGDGLHIAEQLQNLGKKTQIIKAAEWQEELVLEADVIVDALFGVGVNRELVGVWRQIVDKINNSNIPVLSVDLPSGIEPDSGKVLGAAVKANVTMTFIGLKKGLFTGKAKNYSGNIKLNNLGLPMEVYDNAACNAVRLTRKDFKNRLTLREPAAHKGVFGKLLILGGQDGMTGAALLAGKAALRTGVGVVYVLANSKQPQIAHNSCLEIQIQSFLGVKQLKELITKSTVLLLGSGLGLDRNAQIFFEKAMQSDLPLIVDADGLNILAENVDKDFQPRENWILTPHPKEAARLLQTDVAVVEANRFAAIEQLTKKFKATVVLKGAGTLIKEYRPDSRKKEDTPTYVCDLGNPGMATAGMGDLLAGIIAALVAQKLSLKDACNLGVFVHSLAGDVIAKEGQRGMVASDLLLVIKKIINTICE